MIPFDCQPVCVMRLRQGRGRLHAVSLSSTCAPRGTGVVRRTRRDRTRHRGRRGVGRQPADVVARLGSIRSAGRHAAVRPRQPAAAAERLRADHARARPAQHRRDAIRHRTHRRAARSRHRPGSAGVPAFAGELVCAGTTSTVPRVGAGDRFRLVPGARRTRSRNGCSTVKPTSRSPSPRPDGAGLRLAPALRRAAVPGRSARTPAGRPGPGAALRRGGEPFIALGSQSGLRQLTDELWAEDNIDPDIVFEATEIPTMEGLVAAGFGVAVVPVPRDGGDVQDRPRPADQCRGQARSGAGMGPGPGAVAAGGTLCDVSQGMHGLIAA